MTDVERIGKAMADAVALNYDHNTAIFNLYANAAISAMRGHEKPDLTGVINTLECALMSSDYVHRGSVLAALAVLYKLAPDASQRCAPTPTEMTVQGLVTTRTGVHTIDAGQTSGV